MSRLLGWIVAALSFVTVAPTLGWLEFSNGIEQLHAATVLELRRDGGSWLMPTLNGTLRIKKPPLPAWIGATAVTDATVAGVGSPDRAVRDAAFARLAWEIRWPALLAGCLMLVATFDLARTLGGVRVALLATLIAGTSVLFFRFARLATTDVHLALWVTVANALLARAILRRQRWCIAVAGLALGLGFMCKGPVGLLQTVAPLLVYWLLLKVSRRGAPTAAPSRDDGSDGRSVTGPVLLAIVAFLAVALPWPIAVWRSHDGALATWLREIFRKDATEMEPGPFWSYASLLINILPWLPAFLWGFGATCRRRPADRAGGTDRRASTAALILRHRGYLLALLWLLVPVLGMSLVKDKNDRYLLPLLAPTAVIAARGLIGLIAGYRRKQWDARIWLSVQWTIVAVMAVGLPLVGTLPTAWADWMPSAVSEVWPKRIDGSAWFRPLPGIVLTAVFAAFAAGMIRSVAHPARALGLAILLLLSVNVLALWGYRHMPGSRSEMRPIAERILAHDRTATVAYYVPDGKAMPPDLAIYLNRPVRPPPDPARRRQEPEPEVLVTLQRESQTPPQVPGWTSFASEPYGRRFWHAMERSGQPVPESASQPAVQTP